MDFSLSTIFEHFTPATWAIAITLIIMSVLSVGVTLNRAFIFMRSRSQSKMFAESVASKLKTADISAAVKQSKLDEFKFAYLARILRTGLEDASDVQSKQGNLEDLSTVANAMERAVAEEDAFMRKWMTILATVSSTAPFVGLLGTVFGIINSFVGMAASGSGGIGAVAGGIAEALVMTGFGLIVAIPAVWFYNWANASADALASEMKNNASEVLDWVHKNRNSFASQA